MRAHANRMATLLAITALFWSAPVTAQTIIEIAPSPGSAVASGNQLRSTVDTVCNGTHPDVTGVPTFADPYMVKVHPGTYDMQNSPLVMCAYVDIEGSGIDVTFVTGLGNSVNTIATVMGKSNA